MAITIDAVGTPAAGGLPLNVPYVSGITAGDNLYMVVAARPGSGTTGSYNNTITGWTRLGEMNAGSSSIGGALYAKDTAAVGTESGTIAIPVTGGSGLNYAGVMLRGRGAAFPPTVNNTAKSFGSSVQDIATSAMTVGVAESGILAMASRNWNDDSAGVTSWPGGLVTKLAYGTSIGGNELSLIIGFVAQTTATNISSGTMDMVSTAALNNDFMMVALNPAINIEQEGFRFYADGSESAASALAAQDTNINAALNTIVQLRMLLNATGDPASIQYQLEYKKSGDPSYVKVDTAGALGSPSVTFGAEGTSSTGTTSCTPTYPTGISASTSKLYCIVTGRADTAGTAPTMPAGWTNVADLEGGTGTWGVDTGTRRATIFRKDTVAGTETGTVTVSLGGGGTTANNTLAAKILRFEVPASYTMSEDAGTGADTTNGTGYSALSTSSLSWAANDNILIVTALSVDTAGTSSPAVSASGITFGSVVQASGLAVTPGNDHRQVYDVFPVTAGSGSAAPTFTATLGSSASGASAFLRLRAVKPAEPIVLAPSASITASGENTTARLTAPSGKSTSDFVAGRIADDENPLDTVNITNDDYTEVAWMITTQSPAAQSDVYQFRVTSNGAVLNTYTLTPTLTVGSVITGTFATTEAKDTLAAAGVVTLHGTLSVTEVKDTFAAVGKVQLTGVLASTEVKDTLAASGKLYVIGTLAATEVKDTLAAPGVVRIIGTLAATEAKDTSAINGTSLLVSGTLAVTEVKDTFAGHGVVNIHGSLSKMEPRDTAAISGIVHVIGSFAATEARDLFVATGDTGLHGGVGVGDVPDSFSASGLVKLTATLAATDIHDTVAISGGLIVKGSLAALENAHDTASVAGKIRLSGVLVATETRDHATISGGPSIQGTLAVTEAPDTLYSASPPAPVVFEVQRPSFDSNSFALAAFDANSFSMLFGAYADVQLLSPGNLVTLYELDCTPFGGNIERYHNHNDGTITWQGLEYYPWAIEAADFERIGDGQQPNPVLRLGNIGLGANNEKIEGVVSALCLALDDLVGARVVRRRTFAHYLDGQPFADPTQEFPEEIWVIQQKTTETPEAVSFQLSSPLQFNNAELPSRQIIANICSWLWIGGYRGPYCGYTGSAMFTRDGTPTSNPALDKCGGCLSDCKKRFGPDNPLAFGSFPSADRLQ